MAGRAREKEGGGEGASLVPSAEGTEDLPMPHPTSLMVLWCILQLLLSLWRSPLTCAFAFSSDSWLPFPLPQWFLSSCGDYPNPMAARRWRIWGKLKSAHELRGGN